MKISGIQSNVINYNIKGKSKKSKSPSFKGAITDPVYGDAWASMYSYDKLKREYSKYPKDVKYRESLLANLGISPKDQHMIRPIIGPQEIKEVIKGYNDKPQAYSKGETWENVNNHTMRANIHMHTQASDGALTIGDLLDKSAEYANKVKSDFPNEAEPFVVAITDHDTTESATGAVKIIHEKPLKYQNLRVILGSELTSFNNVATDLVHTPINTHVLAYGIDPNEKDFKGFIDSNKQRKQVIEEKMTDTANKVYADMFHKDNFFSVGEAKKQYLPIQKNILGIFNGMDNYFKNKIAVEHVILKNPDIKSKLEERNLPTDTEGFMDKMSEFHKTFDRNCKILPPKKTLPEFVSVCTDIPQEDVLNILNEGLKSKEVTALNKALDKSTAEYRITLNPKHPFMPTFSTLYEGLESQPDAMLGVAHPIDYTKAVTEEDKKFKVLTDLYTKFKKECKEKATFTEAYYQSYKPGRKEFNAEPKTQKFLDAVSKTFGLIKTGSADTHGLNVFVR